MYRSAKRPFHPCGVLGSSSASRARGMLSSSCQSGISFSHFRTSSRTPISPPIFGVRWRRPAYRSYCSCTTSLRRCSAVRSNSVTAAASAAFSLGDPKVLPALSDDRDSPASQIDGLFGLGMPRHVGKIKAMRAECEFAVAPAPRAAAFRGEPANISAVVGIFRMPCASAGRSPSF
jgi:hypothetical protein